MTEIIAHTVKSASKALGDLSVDVIKRAIRSGDLKATRATVDGREIARDLIDPAELKRWASGGAK